MTELTEAERALNVAVDAYLDAQAFPVLRCLSSSTNHGVPLMPHFHDANRRQINGRPAALGYQMFALPPFSVRPSSTPSFCDITFYLPVDLGSFRQYILHSRFSEIPALLDEYATSPEGFWRHHFGVDVEAARLSPRGGPVQVELTFDQLLNETSPEIP